MRSFRRTNSEDNMAKFSYGEVVLVGQYNYRAEFLGDAGKSRYTVRMFDGPDGGRQITVPATYVKKK
jgi:hypothetical protein